jgi:signal transduction histidine kinase
MESDLSTDKTFSKAASLVAAQRRRVQTLRAAAHSTAEAEAVLATFESSLAVIRQLRATSLPDPAAALAASLGDSKPRSADGPTEPVNGDGSVLRIQDAVDRERNDIAQALHDELGQELALMKAQIASLASAPLGQSREHHSAILDLQSRIDAAISSVRRVAFAVRPVALEGRSLGAAIAALASQYRASARLSVLCQIRANTESFNQTASTSVYRIVQEALTNTARHACARHASVELYKFRDVYILRIQDDGIGAPPDVPLDTHSLGLRGMRERVRLLDGRIRLETSPGNGFTIAIQLPEKSVTQAQPATR